MIGKEQRASLMALYQSLNEASRAARRARKGKIAAARPISSHIAHAPIAVTQQLNDIERERKRLENQDFAQNTELKRRTLRLLFRFLAIETGLIFTFAFAQATQWPANFHMEEWSFKLLVSATLAQITAMTFVAVRYLFPAK